jgi:hypothetical protein
MLMPNTSNVGALYDLLQEASVRRDHPRVQVANSQMARFLASRGVLVPGVLTEDELLACGGMDQEAQQVPVERSQVAANVRKRLERIARGET